MGIDYKKYRVMFPIETREDYEDWKDCELDEGVQYVRGDVVRDEYKRGRLVGFALGAFAMLVLCAIVGLFV